MPIALDFKVFKKEWGTSGEFKNWTKELKEVFDPKTGCFDDEVIEKNRDIIPADVFSKLSEFYTELHQSIVKFSEQGEAENVIQAKTEHLQSIIERYAEANTPFPNEFDIYRLITLKTIYNNARHLPSAQPPHNPLTSAKSVLSNFVKMESIAVLHDAIYPLAMEAKKIAVALESRISDLNKFSHDLSSRLARLDTCLPNLEQAYQKHANDAKTHNSQLATLDTRLTNLEQAYHGHANDAKTYNSQLATLDTRLTALVQAYNEQAKQDVKAEMGRPFPPH